MSYRNPVTPARFRILTAYNTQAILTLPLQLISIDGLAYPPVENVTSRAPMQHGSTHLGAYLGDRLFSVALVVKKPWGYALEEAYKGARKQFIDVANSGLGALEFEILMTSSDIYRLKHVYFESGFDIGLDTATSGRHQRTAVRFLTGDPAWYGKERTITLSAATQNTLALPFWYYVTPTENFGNWWSYPEVTLTGPMINPMVDLCQYSISLGTYVVIARIQILGSLGAGEHWYMKTNFGDREVVDDVGNNVSLSEDTAIALFQLAYSPIRLLHSQQANANW